MIEISWDSSGSCVKEAIYQLKKSIKQFETEHNEISGYGAFGLVLLPFSLIVLLSLIHFVLSDLLNSKDLLGLEVKLIVYAMFFLVLIMPVIVIRKVRATKAYLAILSITYMCVSIASAFLFSTLNESQTVQPNPISKFVLQIAHIGGGQYIKTDKCISTEKVAKLLFQDGKKAWIICDKNYAKDKEASGNEEVFLVDLSKVRIPVGKFTR